MEGIKKEPERVRMALAIEKTLESYDEVIVKKHQGQYCIVGVNRKVQKKIDIK